MRNRRPRTKATKANDPNQRSTQMALPGLAPPGQQDTPVQVLPAPDPLDDPPVEPGHQETEPPVPGSTAPTEDAPPEVGAHDRTFVLLGEEGEPAKSPSTCMASIPSNDTAFPKDSQVPAGTSDLVPAQAGQVGDPDDLRNPLHPISPLTPVRQEAVDHPLGRRCTLDALLQMAERVKWLKEKALSERGAEHGPPGIGARESSPGGRTRRRHLAPPSPRQSSPGRPNPGPGGGPPLPPPHGEPKA